MKNWYYGRFGDKIWREEKKIEKNFIINQERNLVGKEYLEISKKNEHNRIGADPFSIPVSS